MHGNSSGADACKRDLFGFNYQFRSNSSFHCLLNLASALVSPAYRESGRMSDAVYIAFLYPDPEVGQQKNPN